MLITIKKDVMVGRIYDFVIQQGEFLIFYKYYLEVFSVYNGIPLFYLRKSHGGPGFENCLDVTLLNFWNSYGKVKLNDQAKHYSLSVHIELHGQQKRIKNNNNEQDVKNEEGDDDTITRKQTDDVFWTKQRKNDFCNDFYSYFDKLCLNKLRIE